MPEPTGGNIHLAGPMGVVLPAHRHDALELNLVTRGSVTYLVDGQRMRLRHACLLWLFPAQAHAQLEASQDYRAWVVHFGPSLVQQWSSSPEQGALQGSRPPDRAQWSAPPPHAVRELEILVARVARARDPVEYRSGLAYLLVSAWRVHLECGGSPQLKLGRVPAAVERAVQLLTEEPSRDLGLNDLARACGVSRARLTRLFREHTGASLVQYRNRHRVQRFLELYAARPGSTFTDVAFEAGFGSYAQFHRVCRATTGKSPRELVQMVAPRSD